MTGNSAPEYGAVGGRESGTPRILMLIPHLGIGGAQGAFMRLAEFLASQASVTIAVMATDSSISVTGQLPLVVLGGSNKPSGKLRRWLSMIKHLRTLKRSHDISISFLSGTNLLNAIVGPARKTVVSERGSKRNDIGMTPTQRLVWTRLLDRLTYLRAGKIVAASEGLSYEICTANPWIQHKVEAIEGTIHSERLVKAANADIEPDLEEMLEWETIFSFGRLHVMKGYDFLIRVFAQVRAARPRARLLLVGDGPERASLERLAVDLGLSVGPPASGAAVVFVGERLDPVRYARLGRIVAFPSRSEGLPNALIEAIAAGVPIMASDCPWGPRSILSAGAIKYSERDLRLPMYFPNGILMPSIDMHEAINVWTVELIRALPASEARREQSACLKAIEIYDINRTGPRWRRIVDDLIAVEEPRLGKRNG